MKAVVMERMGGPDVLSVKKLQKPSVTKPGELLVRVVAAGVNPIDVKQREKGTVCPADPPLILGCDCAGVVEEKSGGSTRFEIGDGLFFMHGGIGKEQGNYAEYTVIDERFAAKKPPSVSFEESGAAPLAFITAYESLFERGKLTEGQTVLIHAGAGGVGHIAVQLAARSGARVITTVSDEKKRDFVLGIGAEKTVLYRDEDFVQAVMDWTGQEGVDLALEMIGGKLLFRTFSCVRRYGRVVTLLAPQEGDWQEARLRNIDLSLEICLGPMYYGTDSLKIHHAELLESCAEMMDNGSIRVTVAGRFPLAAVREAHRLLEEGHTMGKIVLVCEGTR
ncbi:MAG: zinc-binding dehydrogenase [Spirochaetes bacterium]|nr:zinc-binding dehydrogenase [Spirochaetota bacterium]